MVEWAMAVIAQNLTTRGVRQLVVAGGETSGYVVSTLNVRMLRIGHQIAPGVPWTVAEGDSPIALALKSGISALRVFSRRIRVIGEELLGHFAYRLMGYGVARIGPLHRWP